MDENKEESYRLYVPNGLKLRPEYFVGFGKEEAIKAVFVMLLVFGALFLLHMIGLSLIVCVVAFIAIGFATYLALVRDPVANISVIDQLGFLIAFSKQQKKYQYVCHKYWLG